MKRQLRVLLVDDEETFRKVVGMVLRERGGLAVDECESGDDALAAFRQQAYDVVLLDHQMERLTGLNVLQWMAEQKMDTPVIVLTGAGSEHIAVEAMKLGAYDYLRKDQVEHQRLPLIIRGVYERYLFRKDKESAVQALKDGERALAAIELLHRAISTSSNVLKTTLSNIPHEIDRQKQGLLEVIQEEGHDVLDKMSAELKSEYNFISAMTKSLSELAELMYQRSRELHAARETKETEQSRVGAIPDHSQNPT